MKPALPILACLFIPLLGACATSSAGLAQTRVEMTLESETRTPQQVAECAAETMIGAPELRGGGDHYWILRVNAFQTPVIRWDFTARPGGGTVAELRATINVNSGDERVRACL